MGAQFRVKCTTCNDDESFDEYHEANRYWADHADAGHDVELQNQSGEVEPGYHVPAE